MNARKLRLAVRRFEPFETAIGELFESWVPSDGDPVELEMVPLDVQPLHHELFDNGGLADGKYDVAFLVTDWLPMAIDEGHLLNLDPWVRTAIPDHDSAWPPSLRAVQQGPLGVYGLPYHNGPQCLIYRRDLFEDPTERSGFRRAYGRHLRVPETWDEFLDVVHWFSRPEEGLFGTVMAAFPDAHNTVYDLCLQIWSRGGDISDANGQPTLATPAAHTGLDWYRALVLDPTTTYPGARETDSVRAGEIFSQGRVAIMQNWFGFAAHAQLADTSAVQGNVSVAPVPAGAGGTTTSFLVYWVLGIASGSRNPELAFDFIRHATSPSADVLTTLNGGIGCRTATWTHPAVVEQIPFFDRMADLHAIARTLPHDTRVPQLAQIIDDLVASALTTSKPTADLLAEAQIRATALYGRGIV